MCTCGIETKQWQLELLNILKIQTNIFTVKNNISSSIADKFLCQLLSSPFKREYPCVVSLVFMPCGAQSTVNKIRYSYSAPSEIPVNGILYELNSNAVRSQLCSQD
jgi:hypothetical protein